ncbi:hypothetical protein CGRA01v4_07829 [Colletotrichum graminicola]|nr:hypothetical protein CGRA01v4_07829 [Colletotrichum graminicola]
MVAGTLNTCQRDRHHARRTVRVQYHIIQYHIIQC